MMGRKMKKTDKVKEIKEGFRVLDTDSDGYITYEEVKWVFSGLGENLTDEELDEMIRDTDTDRDSLISIEGMRGYYKHLRLNAIDLKHEPSTCTCVQIIQYTYRKGFQ